MLFRSIWLGNDSFAAFLPRARGMRCHCSVVARMFEELVNGAYVFFYGSVGR